MGFCQGCNAILALTEFLFYFMKKCTKCQVEKPFTEFRKDKSKKDWFCSSCNDCYRERNWQRKIWTFCHPMKTHWMTNSRFYRIYRSIIERCNYQNNCAYSRYGWKWIMCEWMNFEEFYNDMYELYVAHSKLYWELNTTIDRINNDAWYRKSNCRWNTYLWQSRNREIVHKYTYMWIDFYLSESEKLFWIKWQTLSARMQRWYSLKEAIEKPIWKNYSWRKKLDIRNSYKNVDTYNPSNATISK